MVVGICGVSPAGAHTGHPATMGSGFDRIRALAAISTNCRYEMLWEVDIYPAEGQPDLAGQRIAADAAEMGLSDGLQVRAAHGYLLKGNLTDTDVRRLARELLSDQVVERAVIAPA